MASTSGGGWERGGAEDTRRQDQCGLSWPQARQEHATSSQKSESIASLLFPDKTITQGMQRSVTAGSLFLICTMCAQAAVLPPPWADPVRNPCAAQPGGWQLLFWPQDGQCYRIFQQGPPCPETMELGPGVKGDVECRCPPGMAQLSRDAPCHPLFKRGPCPSGQYFAPVPDKPGTFSTIDNVRLRLGTCREPDQCQETDHVFWARDESCYPRHTRGPCPKGEILTATGSSRIGECKCKSTGELGQYYWAPGDSCHEHFTRGPCLEPGTLFLPGGQCGCTEGLPHYNADTGLCYEIGGIGPCPPGHLFALPDDNKEISNSTRAMCRCKEGHALWSETGACYRLYTRGPCPTGQFLVNATSCVPIPCRQGRLYFPEESSCYKIGTRGPCRPHEIVLFENSVRPSVDGVSYRGMCGCSREMTDESAQNQCRMTYNESEVSKTECDSKGGMVRLNETCYLLYTTGPCSTGQWLVPVREGKQWFERVGWKKKLKATCECRPGYKLVKTAVSRDIKTGSAIYTEQCQSPSVTLARFLNQNYYAQE
ncbi:uncharacterized protein LOC110828249 isoform X2 [Zootermopsis nevadensis]|uniref:uncharacterized protein LOC110828249 isoform X2 n=1 Tax=Zootermopsis nevadensis TaxID=136037 RepID=UPI000B8E8D23|nr:uncharacterized protein LOC110828249 isoform X2 [Zootermopsis nevadensis]